MNNNLVIDSNLLLLYVVGATSPSYIKSHKRLGAYSEHDYRLLLNVVFKANRVLVTPNTLTETSNLASQISNPARDLIMRKLQEIIEAAEEIYKSSREAVSNDEFIRLGLTDAALLEFGDESYTLLTSDLDLFLAAISKGNAAVNFNHLRDEAYS